MKYDVETILRQQSEMETNRSLWDSEWLDVAERMLPLQADFLGANTVSGSKRRGKIFDEHGELALRDHTSLLEGFLIPRGSYYQALAAEDDELMKIRRVAEWYDAKTKLLFRRRYAPKAGFVPQVHASFQSLGAFGNQALWIDGLRGDDLRPRGLFYRAIHIGQLYIATNFQGQVDRVNRKFTLSARQAGQMFGAATPECALKALKDRKEGERHEYVQAIFPRADCDPERIDAAGLPIGEMYVAMEGKQLIDERGYRKMPLLYSRYETSPTEDYGRGPGQTVLPAVRACQAMMQSLVRAIQIGAEPPLGAPHEDVISSIEYKPRGITYGAVDEQGRRLIQSLTDGADITSADALLEKVYGRIDQAFLRHLVDVQDELKSHVSAAAVADRAGKQGVLLDPIMGRQESELLDPMTEREIDLMAALGDLDDMPPEVREAGGAFKTTYDNPASRLRRAGQAGAFWSIVEAATPFAGVRPEIFDNFDLDEAIRGVAEIQGVPPKWMSDPRKVQGDRDAKAQQAAMAQTIEAAPNVAGAIKDVAQAQQVSGNV